MSAPRLWWSSSSGRLELQMTLEQARSASHQGQCDDDVRALSQEPDIAAQLATFAPQTLRKELREYGAWDDAELADHEQNLQRLLWLAAGDIVDGPEPEHEPRAFYLCGICCNYHPAEWNGDCRDDQARHQPDELDARYGPDGWEEVDMPGTGAADAP